MLLRWISYTGWFGLEAGARWYPIVVTSAI